MARHHQQHRIILFLVLLITLQISASLDVVNVGDYGNKYYRIRLASDTIQTYQISLDHDEYLYIIGSKSVSYELIHLNTNTTIDSELDSNSAAYYLLHPTNTRDLCVSYKNDCTFNLIVSNSGSSTRSISIRFNKNLAIKPNKVYSDGIKLRKRRRYGMKLENSQLPIEVRLTPNPNYETMDIDLYAYSEKKFSSYYFPNRAERNHINNYQEQIIIVSADSYYNEGEWHFFEVYGSEDSTFDDMNYSFQVVTNYEPDNLLKKILLVFAFTVSSSFICGIFISFFCAFRHQILFCLRLRTTPHPNGASKRQVKKLKVISYKSSTQDIDSPQCIICLEDYAENDKIRILKCNHHFHVHCSDEWLYLNNKCPLCQQNITDAQNVHLSLTENIELQADVSFDQEELQELKSEGTSVHGSLSVDPAITHC